jgi:hypothetical protein
VVWLNRHRLGNETLDFSNFKNIFLNSECSFAVLKRKTLIAYLSSFSSQAYVDTIILLFPFASLKWQWENLVEFIRRQQLETVIYTPTLVDFSCCHWNAESAMLATFLVHPELLMSSLQTGKQ